MPPVAGPEGRRPRRFGLAVALSALFVMAGAGTPLQAQIEVQPLEPLPRQEPGVTPEALPEGAPEPVPDPLSEQPPGQLPEPPIGGAVQAPSGEEAAPMGPPRGAIGEAQGETMAPGAAPAPPDSHPAAILQGLDKTTARVSTFAAPVDFPARFGSLQITARTCQKKPPTEPPESAAFLEIVDVRPDSPSIEIFSGWMFASSPAISALEHPVYDVWVIDCRVTGAMAGSTEVPPSGDPGANSGGSPEDPEGQTIPQSGQPAPQ